MGRPGARKCAREAHGGVQGHTWAGGVDAGRVCARVRVRVWARKVRAHAREVVLPGIPRGVSHTDRVLGGCDGSGDLLPSLVAAREPASRTEARESRAPRHRHSAATGSYALSCFLMQAPQPKSCQAGSEDIL